MGAWNRIFVSVVVLVLAVFSARVFAQTNCGKFNCCQYEYFRYKINDTDYACHKRIDWPHAFLDACGTTNNCNAMTSRRLMSSGQIFIMATCSLDCAAGTCAAGDPQPITGGGDSKKAWDYYNCYNPL